MAFPAISAEYVADAADVLAELQENGHIVSVGAKVSDGFSGLGPYVETGEINVFPLEWDADFSDDVRGDDLFFIASNEVDLTQTSHMVRNGNEYQIMLVKPFTPDNITVIYYEFQARC